MVSEFIKNAFNTNLFLKIIEARFNLGFQTVILITGDTNAGKTKFGLLIQYLINKGLLNKKMSMNNYYYSVIDIAKKIDELNKDTVFYDEAGDELDVRAWNNVFNKILSNILQTQRVKRNIYFIIVPHARLITHTHLVLFDFHFVIRNKISLRKQTMERIAQVFELKTKHLMINDFEDFIDYIHLGNFNIPDYKNDKNLKEFNKFVEKYEVFEMEKKNKIALKIKKEAMEVYDKLNKIKRKNSGSLDLY